MAVQTRDAYNTFNCDYLDGFSYGGGVYTEDDLGSGNGCSGPDDVECLAQYHSWDLSLSQTWGPPYDPTSKLWDMTHLWCSGESDAPAVINMEGMSFSQFRTNVRQLSTIQDSTQRENLYSSVLTTLHDEAIFVPITAKRQTAVTNVRVSGFRFGYMEFDLPLANLYPTPPPATAASDSSLSAGAKAGIAVGAVLGAIALIFVVVLVVYEKQGKPIFTSITEPPAKFPPKEAAVVTATSSA